MTESEFIAAVDAVQESVCSYIAAAAPAAKVYNRWAINASLDKWAAILMSDADGDKVHAWTVGFSGLEHDPRDGTINFIAPVISFAVNCFFKFEFGTDAANSEQKLRQETARVMYRLAQHSALGLLDIVETHYQLSMKPIDVVAFGVQQIYQGTGSLIVKLQPVVPIKP